MREEIKRKFTDWQNPIDGQKVKCLILKKVRPNVINSWWTEYFEDLLNVEVERRIEMEGENRNERKMGEKKD